MPAISSGRSFLPSSASTSRMTLTWPMLSHCGRVSTLASGPTTSKEHFSALAIALRAMRLADSGMGRALSPLFPVGAQQLENQHVEKRAADGIVLRLVQCADMLEAELLVVEHGSCVSSVD